MKKKRISSRNLLLENIHVLCTLDHLENYDYHLYHRIQQRRLLVEELMDCEAEVYLHSVLLLSI